MIDECVASGTVCRKVIVQFPENAILDLDDEPAAVAAFLLWAYDVPLPHEVGLLGILS